MFALFAAANIDLLGELDRAIGIEIHDSCHDAAATPSDAIVICGVRRTNRYRIQEALSSAVAEQERSVRRNPASEINNLGNTGIGSCSAVGPAGYTGCFSRSLGDWRQEHGGLRF